MCSIADRPHLQRGRFNYRHDTAGQRPYLQRGRVKLPTRHGRPASIPAAQPSQATDTAWLASVHTCSAADSTTDTARPASVHTCSTADSSYRHGTAGQRPYLQCGRVNYRHGTAGQRPYLQRGRVKLPTRHGQPGPGRCAQLTFFFF